MDTQFSPSRRRSRTRERVAARRMRQMATPFNPLPDESGLSPVARSVRAIRYRRQVTESVEDWRQRLKLKLRDLWWYALHKPYVTQGVLVLGLAIFALFVATHLLGGRLFPNVWSLGVHLGDMTFEEAATALRTAWANSVQIDLVDGDRVWTATPTELGLTLDAEATVKAAHGVGMAGIPMGYDVVPVVDVDLFVAQDYLLRLTERANYAPFSAGYRWEGDNLVPIAGRDGRVLDVGTTMEMLEANASEIVHRRRLELVMTPIPPDVTDPTPYITLARTVAAQPFTLRGYDPFTDEMMTWTTDRDTFTSWLEASADGLSVREDTFASFIEAATASLNDEEQLRYLEPTETVEFVEEAIRNGKNEALLRIRYRPGQYTIAPGDTGYKIARRLGLPFYLLTNANPGLEWERLSVGQKINLPSRDVTMPLEPVPNKRIIIDLDNQMLTAYENGQQVFNWLISSGVPEFPTSPGVYQILSHHEVAFGSTFELCGTSGCGQWEMYWFMGIYEVVPGLMNGFHGAVLLPNGAYLGGGNVGYPYTYGCIMSEDSNARLLYDWAEDGTVVEIISSDYQPVSNLARQVAAANNGAATM